MIFESFLPQFGDGNFYQNKLCNFIYFLFFLRPCDSTQLLAESFKLTNVLARFCPSVIICQSTICLFSYDYDLF